jgi:hypothetical protein
MMDRLSIRVLAICIGVILLLLTYVALLNRGYETGAGEFIRRISYSDCIHPRPGFLMPNECSEWRQTAGAEAIAVLIALAGVLYVNERRKS